MANDVIETLTVNKADGSYQRASQIYTFAAAAGKAGTGAGYTATALDTGLVTMPASTGASMWLIPIHGLKVGDIITAMTINGQLESAGNANVVDADLRALTAVAAGSTDASVGAIAQVSVTADTILAESVTGLTHTIAAGKSYYVLVTGTTLALTDQEILSIDITVNQR